MRTVATVDFITAIINNMILKKDIFLSEAFFDHFSEVNQPTKDKIESDPRFWFIICEEKEEEIRRRA